GETGKKHLDLLRELMPGVARIGVVAVDASSGRVEAGTVVRVAQALGLAAQRLDVSRTEDFELAFQAAVDAKLQALVIARDPLTTPASSQLASLAAKYHLPTAGNLARGGTIVAYG